MRGPLRITKRSLTTGLTSYTESVSCPADPQNSTRRRPSMNPSNNPIPFRILALFRSPWTPDLNRCNSVPSTTAVAA